MRFSFLALAIAALPGTFARIWDNNQLRPPVEVDTKFSSPLDAKEWRTYKPDAREISYKGRWDKRHISWWSAPGIKFGFTGEKVCLNPR
jgi:hypothetical protein